MQYDAQLYIPVLLIRNFNARSHAESVIYFTKLSINIRRLCVIGQILVRHSKISLIGSRR